MGISILWKSLIIANEFLEVPLNKTKEIWKKNSYVDIDWFFLDLDKEINKQKGYQKIKKWKKEDY